MRHFTKKFYITLLIFLCLFWSPSIMSVQAESTAVAPSSRSVQQNALIVGVPTDRCPVSYIDPDSGEIVGIGIDLLKLAADNAGYQITFQALDSSENLKDALDDSRFDLVMPYGSAIMSTSGKKSILSRSLFDSPFTIVVLRGNSTQDQSTLQIGMLEKNKGVAEALHENCPEYQIRLYEDWNAAMKALRGGEVDGLLNNSYVWSYLLQKPSWSDVTVTPATAFSMPYYVAAVDTPENEKLIAGLNKGITSLTQAQEQTIILNYTTKNLYRNSFTDNLYEYRFPLIFTGILLLLTISAMVHISHQKKRYINELLDSKSQLELANDRLEDAAEAETSFLSAMSHDMRTPLNGILGFTDLALRTNDMAMKKEYLEKIDVAGHQMSDLINDVLDMSKITSGKMDLHPEAFEMKKLFEGITDTVALLAQEHRIHLVTEIADDFPRFICADRIRMQQVILNLLTNAIKYTLDDGHVWLAIRADQVREDACNMEITVSDDGIGMSKEFQSRMFEPFSQEHQSRFYNIQGTGLGLSIVKNIVALMHGTISVQSELGKGSTFEVNLPEIPVVTLKGEVVVQERPAVSLAGKHILLAEDNELNYEIARAILQERGKAIVERAENGEEAVRMFQKAPRGTYDVILMDIRMPVMDGFMATRAIRKLDREDAPQIPIIAMTADAFAEDIQRCNEAGMNGHISKPIDPTKMLLVIGESIQANHTK